MEDNLQKLHDLAARLSETEYKLTQANALLAAIVDSAEEAILAKDFDGHITAWNKAAEELYGWSAEEIIGKNISLIVPPDKMDELENVLMHNVRRGESIKLTTERVHKNGSRIPVKLTVSPIRSASGEIVGASSIARPAHWDRQD